MKIYITSNKIKIYLGAKDEEDELVYAITPVADYDPKTLLVEFSEENEMMKELGSDYIGHICNMVLDEDSSGDNCYVYSRR